MTYRKNFLALCTALLLTSCESLITTQPGTPVETDNHFTRDGISYPITRVELDICSPNDEEDGWYEFDFISSGKEKWSLALTCPTPFLGQSVDMADIISGEPGHSGSWSFYTWKDNNSEFFGCYRYYGYLVPQMVDNLWQDPGFRLVKGHFCITPSSSRDNEFTVTLWVKFSDGNEVSLGWSGRVDSIDHLG